MRREKWRFWIVLGVGLGGSYALAKGLVWATTGTPLEWWGELAAYLVAFWGPCVAIVFGPDWLRRIWPD